jgi:septal ring factor EnvC (AmiA/AmiB activator)
MQKDLNQKTIQVDNLEKENDQLMAKLAELTRKDRQHEDNLRQSRSSLQNEINLLTSRLNNTQVRHINFY